MCQKCSSFHYFMFSIHSCEYGTIITKIETLSSAEISHCMFHSRVKRRRKDFSIVNMIHLGVLTLFSFSIHFFFEELFMKSSCDPSSTPTKENVLRGAGLHSLHQRSTLSPRARRMLCMFVLFMPFATILLLLFGFPPTVHLFIFLVHF